MRLRIDGDNGAANTLRHRVQKVPGVTVTSGAYDARIIVEEGDDNHIVFDGFDTALRRDLTAGVEQHREKSGSVNILLRNEFRKESTVRITMPRNHNSKLEMGLLAGVTIHSMRPTEAEELKPIADPPVQNWFQKLRTKFSAR